MKKFLFILLILVLLPSVYSQEGIRINREVQGTASVGETVNVKINVLNPYNEEKTFSIEEKLPNDVEMVYPSEPHETKFFNGIKVSFLKWEKKISPGNVISLEYKIKPKFPGEYSLSPTTVVDLSSGRDIKGKSSNIVVSCVANGICDRGENYLNCNQDCKADANDGVCNPAPGLCDPDCEGMEDCAKGESGFSIWYILIPIILIGIIYLIYKVGGNKNSEFNTPTKDAE